MFKIATVALLGLILWRTWKMGTDLERLQQDVTNLTTVEQSAKALLEGLAAQIRGNIGDAAALSALADQIEATTADLSSAVTDNTVAAEEPPAPPADTTGTDSGPAGAGDTGTSATDTTTGSGTDAGSDTTATDTTGSSEATDSGAATDTTGAGEGGGTDAQP